ncbi:MAG: GNAT family N-acetyltransferase [Candidatus Micrarchaeota archaeon]
MKLSIRKAVLSDRKAIWTWRNDPITRANSRNPASISWKQHSAWFSTAFEKGNPKIFIVSSGRARAGAVLLNVRGKLCEVSVNIAPSFRGRGVGSSAIKLASNVAKRQGLLSLEAFIKKNNLASQKAFEKNGFVKSTCTAGLCKYRKRF